jgi:hypothetical protein
MSELWLFILALPLLFIDWQIAIIWALVVSNVALSQEMLLLDYEGFEIFLIFIAVGSFRRFIIGRL